MMDKLYPILELPQSLKPVRGRGALPPRMFYGWMIPRDHFKNEATKRGISKACDVFTFNFLACAVMDELGGKLPVVSFVKMTPSCSSQDRGPPSSCQKWGHGGPIIFWNVFIAASIYCKPKPSFRL